MAAALPFSEKYRPKDLTDVFSHDEVISSVSRMIDTGKFPHMLFYGPAGTGKTSTAFVIADKIYKEKKRFMVKVLNASDDRGIQVLRDQVKDFCHNTAIEIGEDGTSNNDPDKKRLPKLCILDEADSLTRAAQAALRRIMEDYGLGQLDSESVKKCIRKVCLEEKLEIETSAEDALVALGKGDMRRVLTLLQGVVLILDETKNSTTGESVKEKITQNHVAAVSAEPTPAHLYRVKEILLTMPFQDACVKLEEFLEQNDFMVSDLVNLLYEDLLSTKLPFRIRARIVPVLADLQRAFNCSAGEESGEELGMLVGAFTMARAQAEETFRGREKRDREDKLAEENLKFNPSNNQATDSQAPGNGNTGSIMGSVMAPSSMIAGNTNANNAGDVDMGTDNNFTGSMNSNNLNEKRRESGPSKLPTPFKGTPAAGSKNNASNNNGTLSQQDPNPYNNTTPAFDNDSAMDDFPEMPSNTFAINNNGGNIGATPSEAAPEDLFPPTPSMK